MRLQTKSGGEEVSWNFGSCSSTQRYTDNKQYTERCCLAPGEYTLICNDWLWLANGSEGYGGSGWSGGFMEIQGNKYCDDFIGYKAMRKVNVSGIDMSLKNYFE